MALEPKYYRNWHLAKDEEELRVTELEYAFMRCQEAFARWIHAADEMVSVVDVKHSEHVILHIIRMQNRPKSGATIARLMNRDDLPNVQYSLRKLENAELIRKSKEKTGKVSTYEITEKGEGITNEFSRLRSELLMRNIKSISDFSGRADNATQLLSILTGIYEESARNSTSYNKTNVE